MSQSHSLVLLQVVFSTKERVPFLVEEDLPRHHSYMAGIVCNKGCECYRVGGVSDHVHLAVRLSRTISIADLVQPVKTSLTAWLKEQAPRLRDFAWQRGYRALSYGARELQSLLSYIDGQAEHHRKKTFQEEYLELLEEFGIKYEVQYLWD